MPQREPSFHLRCFWTLVTVRAGWGRKNEFWSCSRGETSLQKLRAELSLLASVCASVPCRSLRLAPCTCWAGDGCWEPPHHCSHHTCSTPRDGRGFAASTGKEKRFLRTFSEKLGLLHPHSVLWNPEASPPWKESRQQPWEGVCVCA